MLARLNTDIIVKKENILSIRDRNKDLLYVCLCLSFESFIGSIRLLYGKIEDLSSKESVKKLIFRVKLYLHS